MKKGYQNIYQRTKRMLLEPGTLWPSLLEEYPSQKMIFRQYLFPIAGVTSALVLLFSLLHHTPVQAIGLGVIDLISSLCGTWFAYLINREYLCRKLNYPDHQALNLTVYSSAIFILFHGIGTALGNIFIGQLFTLISFIFIRTLYSGLENLEKLSNGQKTNILIIASLSIICMPIIISQILMIVFRISAINV